MTTLPGGTWFGIETPGSAEARLSRLNDAITGAANATPISR
jgi:hypothetical protein